MYNAYIIEALRSPIGKFMGSLAALPAPKIGAQVVKALISKTGIDPKVVDEVIVGNVLSAGLGQNPAKQVVMYSGMPDTIPAYSVNKVCASGLKAVALAAESISAGNADLIIAGGIESMTNAPFSVGGARKIHRLGSISLESFIQAANEAKADLSSMEFSDEMIATGLWDCYNDLHMGSLAEYIGEDYKISREEQDEFAFESHKKAAAAESSGKFLDEIVEINANGKTVSKDEGIRRDTTIEKLSELKPVFKDGGTVTAGNSSQISDGASFLLVASQNAVEKYGLKPMAEIETYAASGIDPKMYGLAPISSTNKALERVGMKLDDIDLIELNEAFCVQALGVVKAMGID
ncbi:MAG: thiolase family protein, partial [Candidatus Micrarchaeaceae archaeon]